MTNMYKIISLSILLVVGIFTNNLFAQTFVPVNVTGFNHDIIAEGAGGMNRAEATTTITFDQVRLVGDNVMYSKDFRGNNNPSSPPPFGLPDNRIINSLNLIGANYLLGPYSQNNALVLKTNGESGTLVLETPGVFSRIAFLGASAEGVSSFNLILNFSDGTNTSKSFAVPDWFSGPNFAIKGIGRVHRTQIQNQGPDQFNGNSDNPRLYDNLIILDAPFTSKILTSISFQKTSDIGSTAILAINGITAINAPVAPVATAATNITGTDFTANWLPIANVTNYFIDVSDSPTFSTQMSGYNNLDVGNVTTLDITGLPDAPIYYYRVRARNAGGISASSNTIQVDATDIKPIDVTGFNHDIIANGSGSNQAIASTTNELGSFVLYSKDFRGNTNTNVEPPFGLPVNGKITNDALPGYNYQLAGYSSKNAVILKSVNESDTLMLTRPNKFSEIAFLATSANGASDISVTLNFSDGSTTSMNFTIVDWYNNQSFAIKGVGRLSRLGDSFSGDADNPRLSNFVFTLSSPYDQKQLTSVTFTKNQGGIAVVLAMTGLVNKIPSIPEALAATNVTTSSFTANWNPVPDVTNYVIDVSLDANFSTLLSGYDNLSSGNQQSLDVTGLSPNTTYYYRVRANNSEGTSGNSAVITVLTLDLIPDAPTALDATNITSTGFTANWNLVANAANYLIDVSDNVTFNTLMPGYDNRDVGDVMSFNVTGLPNGQIYYYRVRARNISGVSPSSNIISVGLSLCPPDNYIANTQAKVDEFKVLYPNCTKITGSLNLTDNGDITNVNGFSNVVEITNQVNIVRNSKLNNLDGLQNLRSVGSNFWIAGNDVLKEISVFNKLTSAGRIYIGFNPLLEVISGYESMTSLPAIDIVENASLFLINIYSPISQINGNVNIKKNPSLVTIDALGNVPFINASLTIENNDLLTNLNAFSSLNSVNEIIIKDNSSLINLDKLKNVIKINGSIQLQNNSKLSNISALSKIPSSDIKGIGLIIRDNPLLAICDLPNFCMYLQGTGSRTISRNAVGCESEQAVISACAVDLDGEYCTNAISINALFNQPFNEPKNTGTYSNEGFFSDNDPTFGHDCVPESGTIWFRFIGDGHKYEIRSKDCGSEGSDPAAALYSGECMGLTSVDCHADIWLGDENPDANFRFILDTELGKEYFIMVGVQSLDKDFGEFCLEVTKISPECLVNIPDENFKIYLIENSDINTNGDSEIQCEEAEAYTGSIDCSALSIADITGLESFVNITSLLCNDNNLSQLNVSKNTQLTRLNCSNNALVSLNTSAISVLQELYCFGNQITNLNIASNKSLEVLSCNDNSLTDLDISQNPSLFQIWCYNNQLTTLNLANGINEDFLGVEAFNNPDLTCIQVDDAAFCDANWTNDPFIFDEQHVFSEICTPCLGLNFDVNFLVSNVTCAGDSVIFIDYTLAIDSSVEELDLEFLWDFGNGDSSMDRDPIYKYAQSGDYTISLFVSSSECEDIVIKKDITILDCRLSGNITGFGTLYPSPNSGSFKIDVKLPESGFISMNIYNAEGNKIQQVYIDNKQNVSEDIFIENPGIYYIEIRHNYGVEYLKTIVIK
jgi:Fibronectin type III domain/Receptor L domain